MAMMQPTPDSNLSAYLREPEITPHIRKHACELAIKIGSGELEQVGWLGHYGIIPGGMDVDPAPQWEPVFRVVAAPEREDD